MRRRLALTAIIPLAILGFGSAAPAFAGPPVNHGQCVSSSATSDGKPGRSVIAKNKNACKPPAPPKPLVCEENDDTSDGTTDNVTLDSATNTVTISGSGPGSDGSALQCETSIPVIIGDSITFSYTLGAGTDTCGGGVPRIYALIDGTYYNTFDDDPNACDDATGSFTFPVDGTVTEVGFVYDRGDIGSVTYRNATIGGTILDI